MICFSVLLLLLGLVLLLLLWLVILLLLHQKWWSIININHMTAVLNNFLWCYTTFIASLAILFQFSFMTDYLAWYVAEIIHFRFSRWLGSWYFHHLYEVTYLARTLKQGYINCFSFLLWKEVFFEQREWEKLFDLIMLFSLFRYSNTTYYLIKNNKNKIWYIDLKSFISSFAAKSKKSFKL